jgi:hypothetical protein
LSIGAEEKAGCGTGSGVRSSICDICVEFNRTKNAFWELARQDREQTTKSLFECYRTSELANVSNIFHEDRLDMLEVGRAL